jgi:RHS repeat-associated protein
MLTNAAGEVTATFTYGPYGKPEGSTGSATTPLGFAGQLTDSATGLQFLRARFYDPATGQFLSRDPAIKVSGSAYGYTAGNPVNATDPNGLLSFSGVLGTIGEILEPLNPIKYYEEEIEAIENGCSYLDSISHGLEGALVGAGDATGVVALLRGAVGLAADEIGSEIIGELSNLDMGRNAFLANSSDDLEEIYARLSAGGTPIDFPANREAVELSDGTRIQLRYDSKSGGPAIDIKRGEFEVKIHVK